MASFTDKNNQKRYPSILVDKNHVIHRYVNVDGHYCYDFQSYLSIVATYDCVTDELILYKDWDYSVTTFKHLKDFLTKYTLPYHCPVGMTRNTFIKEIIIKHKDKVRLTK